LHIENSKNKTSYFTILLHIYTTMCSDILMYKTSVYTLVKLTAPLHIKNRIYKNVILHSMTLPKCQCTAEQYHIFIFAVFDGVKGDITIQCEWSNFDPSQNPNPWTDYDKTLHNWLRPRGEHVTQNVCQSTARERLGKYVKYKALSFFILIYFSRTRLLKRSVDGFSRTVPQITRNHAKIAFLRSARWPKTFKGSNSPKP